MLDLHKHAERLGIPERTKDQVISYLAQCAKKKSDKAAANLLLKHGRLTTEAREYVLEYVA